MQNKWIRQSIIQLQHHLFIYLHNASMLRSACMLNTAQIIVRKLRLRHLWTSRTRPRCSSLATLPLPSTTLVIVSHRPIQFGVSGPLPAGALIEKTWSIAADIMDARKIRPGPTQSPASCKPELIIMLTLLLTITNLTLFQPVTTLTSTISNPAQQWVCLGVGTRLRCTRACGEQSLSSLF